jgi:hypothetical protein
MPRGVFAYDLSDHCPIVCIRDTMQKQSEPCLIKNNTKMLLVLLPQPYLLTF